MGDGEDLEDVARSNRIRSFVIACWRSAKKGMVRRMWHYAVHGHFLRRWRIGNYLRAEGPKRLQLGGGYHTKNGWLNSDLIAGDVYLNATQPFPLPPESIDLIFAEQFIEHLSFSDGYVCLSECRRVLRWGGKVRFSTPDLVALCLLYGDKNPNVGMKTAMDRHRRHHNRELTTPAHFLNDFFRLWGHSFIYDEETLRLQLQRAGFANIVRMRFGESDEEGFAHLERHADVEWMKNGFQIIVEAQKVQSDGQGSAPGRTKKGGGAYE